VAGVEGMTPAIARRVWEFLQTLVVAEDEGCGGGRLSLAGEWCWGGGGAECGVWWISLFGL
jgi:hypothetical protein